MRLQDITDAINADDEADVRQVFRVLVEYPNEDVIEDATPAKLESALVTICSCLSGPGEGASLMPRQLRQVIADAIDVVPESPGLVTYKDGAKAVRAHMPHWVALYGAQAAK